MNDLYIIFLVSFIPIAFLIGYFFDPDHNSITIHSRNDLKDILHNIYDEQERTEIYLYYHDVEFLLGLNDDIERISIDLTSPNSYPIKEPWDYDTWKFHFFGNKTDPKYIAWMNQFLNETEPEIDFDTWQSHFFSERAPPNVDHAKWMSYFFNKTDPNTDDRPKYIHVQISPDEQGVLLIQKGNWTYSNLSQ